MGFKQKILEPWVNQAARSDRYGFAQFKSGLNFLNYPFKIHMISCNAPVIFSDSAYLKTETSTFVLKIAMNKAVVYDVSKMEVSRKKPMEIVRRDDGRYLKIGIQGERKFLTKADLSAMEVPITINGTAMIEINPAAGKYGPEISLPLETTGGVIKRGMGYLFLELTHQDIENLKDDKAPNISAATIYTQSQMESKYNSDIEFLSGEPRYIKRDLQRTRTIYKIYNAEASVYVGLNSVDSLFTKAVVSSYTFSRELAIARQRNKINGAFSFIFQPRPYPTEISPTDNLFIRL